VNAKQTSLTATLIAAATVMCEHDLERPPPVGAAPWCARFLRTTRQGRWLLASARLTAFRKCWGTLEHFALLGIVAHCMYRKRTIDRLTRMAAGEGFTQLVVLGAGFDSLAFRMHSEGTFAQVISADHPATLSTVKTALSTVSDPAGGDAESSTPDIELLAIDLMSDDVQTVLSQTAAFDPHRATLFVIEGVLMYLPESEVARLLQALAELPCEHSRLIASWMQAANGLPIGFRGQSGLINRMLSLSNEKMLWGSTPEKLPSTLAEWGWSCSQIIDLGRHDPESPAPSIGLPSEQLVVATGRP